MVHGVALEGTSVILAFGRPTLAERRFVAANDNGPRDPVKTVTVRRMLEQSGVAIKVKVPVTEFIGVAVATRISDEGVLTSSIELVSTPSSEILVATATPMNSVTGTLTLMATPLCSSTRRTVTVLTGSLGPLSFAATNRRSASVGRPKARTTEVPSIATP